MRIVFLGTADFSAFILNKLLDTRHEIVAAVTQPDKKRGRNEAASFSPVKKLALENNIKVLQFAKISREGVEAVESLNADIFVTAAFGQIMSQRILYIPRLGVINVHASLLPKYRGSAPIQWAVINGETETGITIMKTALAVDSGDIIMQKSLKINPDETAGELFLRLSELGAKTLIEALELIESGKAVFTPQNPSEATYYPMFKKEDGKIDFNKSANELKNFILGVTPWPTAFTFIEGKILKIFKIAPADGEGKAGEVLKANNRDGLIVALKSGAVEIMELQAENSKRMSAKAYLSGHKIETGKILGE